MVPTRRGRQIAHDQVNPDSGTPTTWPRRAQALASAAAARVFVTRSLAASCARAPRSAARRRRWSSGSLAVARATSASSGAFGSSPPFPGSASPCRLCGGCASAPPRNLCAAVCRTRRCERGQASRPAMAPGCVAQPARHPLRHIGPLGRIRRRPSRRHHKKGEPSVARWAATSGSGLWLGPVPSSLS
jgi:hypothetical protein